MMSAELCGTLSDRRCAAHRFVLRRFTADTTANITGSAERGGVVCGAMALYGAEPPDPERSGWCGEES